MLNQGYLNTHNFLIICLDSLRYDTAIKAQTPNIRKYAHEYCEYDYSKRSPFRRVYSQATFTLLSHLGFFYGKFPDNRTSNEPYYNGNLLKMFVVDIGFAGSKKTNNGIVFENSPNIIRGFKKHGYDTTCIGGVNWWNEKFKSTGIWRREFFDTVYWQKSFNENSMISIMDQLLWFKSNIDNKKKQFVFINISATHWPYLKRSQEYALDQFDKYLPDFINHIRSVNKNLFLILVSDHGDILNQSLVAKYGQRHAMYLPEHGNDIMQVPMLVMDFE